MAVYGEEQRAAFQCRGATETRTHDMHIPEASLTENERSAILGMSSWGAGPSVRRGMVIVPCFFRPYVAAILTGAR